MLALLPGACASRLTAALGLGIVKLQVFTRTCSGLLMRFEDPCSIC